MLALLAVPATNPATGRVNMALLFNALRPRTAIMASLATYSQNRYSGRGNNDRLSIMTHLAIIGHNNDPFSTVNSPISALRARDYWHNYSQKWLRIRG